MGITKKRIFVLGNQDLGFDSLPIRLMPQLRDAFPHISFEVLDPNEDWSVPNHMIIIDTVMGIDQVTIFDSLDVFTRSPRVTCHDFDAYANLLLLKKIGALGQVTIIATPMGTETDCGAAVCAAIRSIESAASPTEP